MPAAVPRSTRTSPMRFRTVSPAFDSGLNCQPRVTFALAARAGTLAASIASAAVTRRIAFILELLPWKSARLVAVAPHPDGGREQGRRRGHAEPQFGRAVEVAQAPDRVDVAELGHLRLEISLQDVLPAATFAQQAIEPEQAFGDEVADVLGAHHDALEDP